MYDLYTGWIVAAIDGQWRQVEISPGWVTLADWLHPNEHEGVFSEPEAARLIQASEERFVKIEGTPLNACPHAAVGDIITDPDVLDRIAFVRFGRVPTGEERFALLDFGDMTLAFALLNDLDDSNGLDPTWNRFPRDPADPLRISPDPYRFL